MNNDINNISENLKIYIARCSASALRDLAIALPKIIKKNFTAGGRPDPWPKRKRINKKQRGTKLMVISGNLSNVSADADIARNIIAVTTNPLASAYAAIQQHGGIINMPARVHKFRQVTTGKYKGRTVFASSRHKRISKQTHGKSYTVTIPPRPYLVIPPEEYQTIINIVKENFK